MMFQFGRDSKHEVRLRVTTLVLPAGFANPDKSFLLQIRFFFSNVRLQRKFLRNAKVNSKFQIWSQKISMCRVIELIVHLRLRYSPEAAVDHEEHGSPGWHSLWSIDSFLSNRPPSAEAREFLHLNSQQSDFMSVEIFRTETIGADCHHICNFARKGLFALQVLYEIHITKISLALSSGYRDNRKSVVE